MANYLRHRNTDTALHPDEALRQLARSGRHELAGPVYHPPKPYRIWVAPWKDANNVMHSGEMLYFVDGGERNYGMMGTPGSASGLLGPAMPAQQQQPQATTEDTPQQTEARGVEVIDGAVAPAPRVDR